MPATHVNFETGEKTEVHPHIVDFTKKLDSDICQAINDNLSLFSMIRPTSVNPELYVCSVLSILAKRLTRCMLDCAADPVEAQELLHKHIATQLAHLTARRTN